MPFWSIKWTSGYKSQLVPLMYLYLAKSIPHGMVLERRIICDGVNIEIQRLSVETKGVNSVSNGFQFNWLESYGTSLTVIRLHNLGLL